MFSLCSPVVYWSHLISLSPNFLPEKWEWRMEKHLIPWLFLRSKISNIGSVLWLKPNMWNIWHIISIWYGYNIIFKLFFFCYFIYYKAIFITSCRICYIYVVCALGKFLRSPQMPWKTISLENNKASFSAAMWWSLFSLCKHIWQRREWKMTPKCLKFSIWQCPNPIPWINYFALLWCRKCLK